MSLNLSDSPREIDWLFGAVVRLAHVSGWAVDVVVLYALAKRVGSSVVLQGRAGPRCREGSAELRPSLEDVLELFSKSG